jgi:hypothetical protein
MSQCPFEARIPIIQSCDMRASCILPEGHDGSHHPAEEYRKVVEAFQSPTGFGGLSAWTDPTAPPEPREPEPPSEERLVDASRVLAKVLLRLAGWNKQVVFHYPVMASMTEQEQHGAASACLGYILRRLSRGLIPDPHLVMDTLEGREKVPSCGYLGCTADDDHTH